VSFSFKGKSGVYHERGISHPRVAKTIRACIDLPGYQLFQYVDKQGVRHTIDSADVNEYLKEHANGDFSAKDFRTWGGSVLAGKALYKKGGAKSEQDFKDHLKQTVEEVSTHLGNTKNVCRAYYIHPKVIKSYEKGVLVPHFASAYKRSYGKRFRLLPEEYATWSLIKDY
jgi:DNA topoisomerase-1